jgi:AAA15 family ATPase/GTPase
LAIFSSKENNTKGAQLIATTHDTNILSSDLVRRDQIWFCEKGPHGETLLFPLTDIKIRSTDNVEKGYLQGRFGAIPFAGPPGKLLKAFRHQ